MHGTINSISLRELQTIPGIGPGMARDLWDLGYRSIIDLKDKDPEKMYDSLCSMAGKKIDRCVLYAFRCAVYYASNSKHDPEMLKWWNWKDKPVAAGLKR